MPCPKPTSAWHSGHCLLHVFKLHPCLVRLPQNCKLVANLVQSFAPGFAPSFAPKKTRHGKKLQDTHLFPPGRLTWQELHRPGRSTCCSSGTPPLLDNITRYSSLHAFACLYICGLRMCSDLICPFYLAVSGLLAEGERGKRKLPPWQLLRWRLGWKDCSRSWLWRSCW